ncbi:MAG TPA: M1 family metallopeptidase [Oculatellaceae cyanobacterium]|jgi:aminopeptidase N
MLNNLSERLGLIALSFFLVGSNASCAADKAVKTNKAGKPEVPAEYRLPEGVCPKSYDLFFQPDLTKRSFIGKETISITVASPRKAVVLNGIELNIQNAALTNSAGRTIKLKVVPEAKYERIHFESGSTIDPGNYQLSLNFTGILNDKLRGFYRSDFKDKKGVTHYIATTQMEPTDARRMFPCFDEPGYKATYKVTAAIDPALVAISNSAVAADNIDARTHKRVMKFEETPIMSSYLLALVVGPFKSTPVSVSEGVPVKVWCVADRTSLGTYAQQVALKLLPYYNKYFGVAYPAKKLDLIAIPDFEAGAMENLGCITFRESALLIHDKSASTSSRMEVSSIVAHEMAHMWFGDLVTMKWWDDLWLNEAFATWMATKACDVLRPDWHEWDRFAAERAHALESDSLMSTRPIHFNVDNPLQALEMFDEITYTKGASILRMLERYVGEDTFQKGIQDYIKAHQFSNATTEDLWNAIGAASKSDVSALMKNWVLKPGYPLVDIQKSDRGLDLVQYRFILIPASTEQTPIKTIWHTPLSFRHASEPSPEKFLFADQNATLTKPMEPPFTANAHGDGYFRVKYTDDQLKKLSASIESFDVQERLGLLTDQWALCFNNKVSIESFLALTRSYADEKDPTVIDVLIDKINGLYKFITPAERPAFAAFVRGTLSHQKDEFGWQPHPGESDLTALARVDVLKTLGTVGQDQSVIEKARQLFTQYSKNTSSLDPNIAEAVTVIVAYNGTAGDYKQLTKLWQTAPTPEIEKRTLMALALFKQPELADQTLAMAITDRVRTQDAPRLLGRLLGQIDSSARAFAFIEKNWLAINKRFPQNSMPQIVSATASSFTTSEQESRARVFVSTHPMAAGKRTIRKTLEWIHGNVIFRRNAATELNNSLAKK